MGRYPGWKNSATDPVLRLLAESDLALSSTSITYNLESRLERPPSRSTVTRALSGALDKGLVHQPYGSLYVITDRGRAYLDGELTAEELEE